MSQIEALVKETRAAIIIAKSDGVLDAGEVIQIAVQLVQKIQKIANLSGKEKKSLLLHTLKKGLDDSGGLDALPAFANASQEMKETFQAELLNAASSAVDLILSAASGKLDLRKPSLGCVLDCFKAASVLLPKEQKALSDAIAFTASIAAKAAQTDDVVTIVAETVIPTGGEVSVEVTIPGTS